MRDALEESDRVVYQRSCVQYFCLDPRAERRRAARADKYGRLRSMQSHVDGRLVDGLERLAGSLRLWQNLIVDLA